MTCILFKEVDRLLSPGFDVVVPLSHLMLDFTFPAAHSKRTVHFSVYDKQSRCVTVQNVLPVIEKWIEKKIQKKCSFFINRSYSYASSYVRLYHRLYVRSGFSHHDGHPLDGGPAVMKPQVWHFFLSPSWFLGLPQSCFVCFFNQKWHKRSEAKYKPNAEKRHFLGDQKGYNWL